MVTSRGYFDPICRSANSYRSVSIDYRAIAQLPVIVMPPGVELPVCVDRQAVAPLCGYFDPICVSTDSYRSVSIDSRAIAQLSAIVTPPGVEFAI